jgi:porin
MGVVWLATDSPVQAGTPTTIVASGQSGPSRLSEWWNGKYASADWFGVRDILEDEGLTLGGQWTGCYYGVVDGGKPNARGSFFDEEITFTGSSTLRN